MVWVALLVACSDISDSEYERRVDGDADGVSFESDCDDSDPGRWPGNVEVCNGVDDNCSGHVDDASGCWTSIYRHVHPTSGVGCWSDELSPSGPCLGYRFDREAFLLMSEPVDDQMVEVLSCRTSTHDRYILARHSAAHVDAVGRGTDCEYPIGWAWPIGAGPDDETLPAGLTACPVWRWVVPGEESTGHWFATGGAVPGSAACEAPARFVALSRGPCFEEAPAGCIRTDP